MAKQTHRQLALLWKLGWNDHELSCVVYRATAGRLELRLESPRSVVIAEPFAVAPRMIARAQALRKSLKRRGWKEI